MNASNAAANGIGQPVRRKEDFRLLTGKGCFGDDVAPPGLAHAVILRSPHAHARIASVDTAAALAAPGVLAVLTGADYRAAGLGPIPHNPGLSAPPDVQARTRGFAPIATVHFPLPADTVRYVGEPVAIVVAETIAAAKDAAELLDTAYEPLPAVVGAADALMPGAPVLWETAPGNLCLDVEVGDEAAIASAFARAAHVVRLETRAQRVTGVPMEPRTNVAEYDPGAGRYTLYTGSGRGVAKVRLDLAQVLGVPPEQVRVLCRDMGGNFGTRNLFYPEYALLAWAARRVGRPVKWTCERHESFLSDYQGRDLTVEAELALDEQGNFLATPRLQSEQSRRPRRRLRAIAKRPRADVERLPRAGRLFPRAGRRHQHGLDNPLPQRRPARGDLCHRAAGGFGGRPARARPGGAAPTEHDPARGAALCQPARRHL